MAVVTWLPAHVIDCLARVCRVTAFLNLHGCVEARPQGRLPQVAGQAPCVPADWWIVTVWDKIGRDILGRLLGQPLSLCPIRLLTQLGEHQVGLHG